MRPAAAPELEAATQELTGSDAAVSAAPELAELAVRATTIATTPL